MPWLLVALVLLCMLTGPATHDDPKALTPTATYGASACSKLHTSDVCLLLQWWCFCCAAMVLLLLLLSGVGPQLVSGC
jgi:hypothetical protein